MEGRFRDRDRRIGRNPAKRQPKHRILVVCEGKVTEPKYFQKLQHAFRNPLVHVEIHKQAGVPMTVVDRAIELNDEARQAARRNGDGFLNYDEVWCVFDVDEHPRLEKALKLAEDSGFQVALSNPCFELWALLHFRDQVQQVHRREVQGALKEILPKYDKELDFGRMHGGYEDAVKRAQSLEKSANAVGDPRRNPSTSVYRLTEQIRTGG